MGFNGARLERISSLGPLPRRFGQKAATAFVSGDATIPFPTSEGLFEAAERMEPGLGSALRAAHRELDPRLDYETELGVVLLEDIPSGALEADDYAPRLGFFVANDLSARALALLGEGQDRRYAYWGISKSLARSGCRSPGRGSDAETRPQARR